MRKSEFYKNEDKKSYYDILEIPPHALPEQVYEGYIRAKNTYQGDGLALYSVMTRDECLSMLEIIETAYSVLSIPHKRREYDLVRGFRTQTAAESYYSKNQNSYTSNRTQDGTLPTTPSFLENSDSNSFGPSDFARAYAHEKSEQKEYLSRNNSEQTPNTSYSNYSNPQSTMSSNVSYTFEQRNSVRENGDNSGGHQSSFISDEGKFQSSENSREFQINHRDADVSKLAAQKRFGLNYSPNPAFDKEIESISQFTGAILKKIREYKDVSLERMCDLTKISRTYLKNIEDDDVHKLPPLTYIRGFVYQYAKCLRLNADQVANSYINHLKFISKNSSKK